jgi:hypothetical protein
MLFACLKPVVFHFIAPLGFGALFDVCAESSDGISMIHNSQYFLIISISLSFVSGT